MKLLLFILVMLSLSACSSQNYEIRLRMAILEERVKIMDHKLDSLTQNTPVKDH